jgi:hypothetical protein
MRRKKVISKKTRQLVITRDNGRCRACGIGDVDAMQCDHVIPESKGGKDTLENLQALCGVCNNRKGSTDVGELEIQPAIDGFGNFAEVMSRRADFVALVAEKREQEILDLYRQAEEMERQNVRRLIISKRLKKIANDRTVDKIMRELAKA